MKPVLLIGEAQGSEEHRINSSFVGPSGIELLRMLDEAEVIELTSTDRDYLGKYYSTGDPKQVDMIWRLHPEVHRTNVFNLHPPGNRLENLCGGKAEGIPGFPALIPSKFCRREYEPQLERLGDEIIALDPNLIVALGNTPLWALCGRTGVSKLRGTTLLSTHTVSNYKVLSTYHPAAVLRQWELRPTTVIDLMKVNRESAFPEVRRPACEIWVEPTLEDIARYTNERIQGCTILAVDIETSGNRITCIGFSPSPSTAIVIPFDDERAKGGSYWPNKEAERQAWALVRNVLFDRGIPKSFQNGLYDIAFLWRSYGIGVLGAAEDTMLLHHALQPEALKGLAYLGSVYTDHGAWKSERKGTNTTIKRDA